VPARPDLAAVILAAGRSSRMGSFKPLLPFGRGTVMERVISTVYEAGVETIRIVVGWNAHLLIPILERLGVPWVRNERFEEGMYTSVRAGVRDLPTGVAAFFLLPGDIPLAQSATLTRLIAEWDKRPGGIFCPCFEGGVRPSAAHRQLLHPRNPPRRAVGRAARRPRPPRPGRPRGRVRRSRHPRGPGHPGRVPTEPREVGGGHRAPSRLGAPGDTGAEAASDGWNGRHAGRLPASALGKGCFIPSVLHYEVFGLFELRPALMEVMAPYIDPYSYMA